MKTEMTYLAGGCFWGMEELIRQQNGVVDVEVGYSGGMAKHATYELVKTGSTQHAEAVMITFNPEQTSFKELLFFFFKIHDPTTTNRQGNDVGTQYRSAIFYVNEEQMKIAQEVKAIVDKSGAWKNPVVTEITKFTEFWKAEDYHQDYLQKHPNGYTCHFIRNIDFKK